MFRSIVLAFLYLLHLRRHWVDFLLYGCDGVGQRIQIYPLPYIVLAKFIKNTPSTPFYKKRKT